MNVAKSKVACCRNGGNGSTEVVLDGETGLGEMCHRVGGAKVLGVEKKV